MNKLVLSIMIVIAALTVLAGGGLLVYVFRADVASSADAQLGDQYLKTTAALSELHRTRYGTYPNTLADLTFVGEGDRLALSRVAYTPAPDRRTYYLEVTMGWIGKPTLNYPEAFWQGTGYRPALKPSS